MKTFFFFDLNEDDIVTNLTDAAPRNDVFTFAAGKKTEFTGTRYDQCCDFAGFAVKFQIDRTAETAAGAGVDDFFLSKLT